MWQLIQAKATNLFSFREIDYKVKNGVATSVTGINLDNSNQGSNGSGKSSLLELFALGITGSPLRKVKIEEVINDAAETAHLKLHFCNPGLKEELIIKRTISRKEAQVCTIQTIIDGVDKTKEVSNLSGLENNNAHILNKLGITREELFNHFLLSKYKHESFLSASDNKKKEIINSFSNGVLVDKAIAKLQEDMVPIQTELNEVTLEGSRLKGRMDATEEQIVALKRNQQEQEEKRLQSIKEKKDQIAEHNKNIRLFSDSIEAHEKDLSAIDSLLVEFDKLDRANSPSPFASLRALDLFWEQKIAVALPLDENDEVGVYSASYENLLKENSQTTKDLEAVQKEIAHIGQGLKLLSEAFEREQRNYTKDLEAFNNKVEVKKSEVDALRETFMEYHTSIKTLRGSIAEYEKLQGKYNKILAGVITCPKCQHQFVLSEDDINLDLIKIRANTNDVLITEAESKVEKKLLEMAEIQAKGEKANADLQNFRTENLPTKADIDKITAQHQALSSKEILVKSKLSKLESRQAEFDREVLALIKESYKETSRWLVKEQENIEGYIQSDKKEQDLLKQRIQICASAIKELEEKKDDSIRTLTRSMVKYQQEWLTNFDKQDKVQKRLNALIEQEANFVKFKTHLANTKIDALSEITNSFLECIGSDLRIEFQGVKILKSGKVRDKISVNLLRDGIDVGSLGKLSLGEQARVHLACILAMFKLTNINCEDGRGLDLLVLDEVLEGVDEPGLMGVIYALNDLGITSLIVSQLKAAENYENVLIIQKENGESTLQ